MMTCDDILLELDDYLDQLLDEGQRSRVQAHINQCQRCQQSLHEEMAWRQTVRALPVAPASEGFAQRALQQAKDQQQQSHRHNNFLAGFSSAIAAGLAIWMVTAVFLSEPGESPQNTLKTVNIVLYESTKVKLAFDSPRELGNAKVSLLLPDHVELEGFPGQKQISWHTNLRQGRNMLSLPLRAIQLSQGKLEARIEHEGKSRVIQINLNANKPGMTNIEHELAHMV